LISIRVKNLFFKDFVSYENGFLPADYSIAKLMHGKWANDLEKDSYLTNEKDLEKLADTVKILRSKEVRYE
jgi:hypothetical protein